MAEWVDVVIGGRCPRKARGQLIRRPGGAPHGGFKFLRHGQTENPVTGARFTYATPGITVHPEPLARKGGGGIAGPGRIHVMRRLDAAYVSAPWDSIWWVRRWGLAAYGEAEDGEPVVRLFEGDCLGANAKKFAVHWVELVPVRPEALARMLRPPFCWGVGSDLQHLELPGADLRGARLAWADLQGVDWRGADLREADLSHAAMPGSYLMGANLRGANLKEANLVAATLEQADFGGARMAGACLYRSRATGARFAGANLQKADLRGMDLRGADFSGADLRWADLRESNLDGATLRSANLAGTDLLDVDLRDADLRGTNWEEARTRNCGRQTASPG